jgi:hypothetical protein
MASPIRTENRKAETKVRPARGQSPRAQVELGEHDQVEEQQHVVEGEEYEAQRAPQQQAQAAARVAAEQEHGAREAGQHCQRVEHEIEGDHG